MLIVCNGMIRSGSTLQYNLIRELLNNTHRDYIPLGFMQKDEILIKRDILNNYISDKKVYLLKTHDFTFLNNSEAHIIYSYRDIRDVAASVKKKTLSSNVELLQKIAIAMNEHNKIVNSNKLITIKYENMCLYLENTIHDIAMFLNIECNDKLKLNIIKKVSISNIEKKQKYILTRKFKSKLLSVVLKLRFLKSFLSKNIILKVKKKLYSFDSENLMHINHISETKGKSNVWINELNNYEIEEINRNYFNWLRKYNYEKEENNEN